MKKYTKILLFSLLGALLLCAVRFGAGEFGVLAENTYSYAVDFELAPTVKIEDRIRMDAAGIKVIESDNFYSEHGHSFAVFENNVRYRFKLKIDAEQDGPEYRVFFAGQSQWRSYWLNFNRGESKIALHSAGGASAGSGITAATSKSFEIDTEKTFDITLCVIDIYSGEKIVGDRVVASVSDGEKSASLSYDFIGEDRNGAVREEIYGGATGKCLGVYAYQGVYEINFLPADFSRDYVVYIDDGERKVLHEISYGDAYDFTSDVDLSSGRELIGFKAIIDGVETDIPASGVWTTDITVKTGSLYSARIYPVFVPVAYNVVWDLPSGAAAIDAPNTVSDVMKNLPAVSVTDSDKAFFGWYLDSEYSEPAVLPLAITRDITLYGKVDALPAPSAITYVLGEGAVNHADNPSSYTMRDSVELKAPSRDGYLFCGFAEGGSIAAGTQGAKTFTALWIKDEFPKSDSVFVSSLPRRLPLYPIPSGASCTVSLTFGGESVDVSDASAIFANAGEYVATYSIALPLGGSAMRTVKLTAQPVSLSVQGEYKSSYFAGETLVLFDATASDPMLPVSVGVYKNGTECGYKNFSVVLEKGDYRIVYSAEGADDVIVSFSVESDKSGKGCSATNAGFIVLWVALGIILAGGISAAVIILVKKSKKQNKKGEEENVENKE